MLDQPPDFLYTSIDGMDGKSKNQKHSVLGIISFAFSILNLILTCVFFVLAAVSSENRSIDETVFYLLIGLYIVIVFIMVLVGLVLGVAGLFQREKRKIFSIIGVVINGLLILSYLGLYVIGVKYS